jgi:hypothetical protein
VFSFDENDTASDSVTSPSTLKSTALADNNLDSSIDFSVYQSVEILIPLSTVNFFGEKRFVKVISQQLQTVFLGQLPSGNDFLLPLYLEVIAFPVVVEIFSEKPEDKTITMEVGYE